MEKITSVFIILFLFFILSSGDALAQINVSASSSVSVTNSSVATQNVKNVISAVAASGESGVSATACSNQVCAAAQAQGGTAAAATSSPPAAPDQSSGEAVATSKKTAKNDSVKSPTATSETPVAQDAAKIEAKKGEVTIAESQKTKANVLPDVTKPPQVSAAKDAAKLPKLSQNNWQAIVIIILIALTLGAIAYYLPNALLGKKARNEQPDLFSYQTSEKLDDIKIEQSEPSEPTEPEEKKESRW